jgi:hypothetical protein
LYFLNTEQPQTDWFKQAEAVFPLAGHVFDMDSSSARVIQASGLSASYLPLGFVEDFAPYAAHAILPSTPDTGSLGPEAREWQDIDQPLKSRPIDVSFVGGATLHRMSALAAMAPLLEEYECHLRLMPEDSGPWMAGRAPVPHRTLTTAALAQRSKIVINIHRGPERPDGPLAACAGRHRDRNGFTALRCGTRLRPDNRQGDA